MKYKVEATFEFDVDLNDDITIEQVMEQFEVSFNHPDEATVHVVDNEFVVSEHARQ